MVGIILPASLCLPCTVSRRHTWRSDYVWPKSYVASKTGQQSSTAFVVTQNALWHHGIRVRSRVLKITVQQAGL